MLDRRLTRSLYSPAKKEMGQRRSTARAALRRTHRVSAALRNVQRCTSKQRKEHNVHVPNAARSNVYPQNLR